MITVGIDVGSITTKAAAAKDGEVIADKVVFTGYNVRDAGQKVFEGTAIRSMESSQRGMVATVWRLPIKQLPKLPATRQVPSTWTPGFDR